VTKFELIELRSGGVMAPGVGMWEHPAGAVVLAQPDVACHVINTHLKPRFLTKSYDVASDMIGCGIL
jgi:hypothetical protein